jgi:DNA-binding transcriptional LysR family regulator
MDTDRLRYFCAVARTGSLRRAAELSNVSAPALSKAIKLLEAECGARLVEPSGRGLVLTEEGVKLAERGGQLLGELDALRTSLREPAPRSAELRLGSFEVFTTYALGEILSAVGEGVPLLLHELVPGKMEEALVARRIDWGITYVPIPHPDLDFLPAATVTMGVFARAGVLETVATSDLPFAVPVTPIEGSPTKIMGLDGWPDHEAPRHFRYRVTLMESALELCRLGLAAAYLPTFIVAKHNKAVRDDLRLTARKPPTALASRYLKQPVYLVRRKGSGDEKVGKRLAKALRILCRD